MIDWEVGGEAMRCGFEYGGGGGEARGFRRVPTPCGLNGALTSDRFSRLYDGPLTWAIDVSGTIDTKVANPKQRSPWRRDSRTAMRPDFIYGAKKISGTRRQISVDDSATARKGHSLFHSTPWTRCFVSIISKRCANV